MYLCVSPDAGQSAGAKLSYVKFQFSSACSDTLDERKNVDLWESEAGEKFQLLILLL